MEFTADAREAVRKGTAEGGDDGDGAKAKGRDLVGRFFSSKHPLRVWALSLSVLLSSLAAAATPFGDDDVANRALSFLTLVVSLWIFEALPFHSTAMFIPVLAVVFDVLRSPEDPDMTMTPEEASKVVLGSFFNHNTFLILGGYAISSAFSRCEVETVVASALQVRFEDRPYLFLLAMMMLGLFLSMWISNHTAPVLCIAVLSPIIGDYGAETRFVKALLLGVAFACNFGGMLTPIASLQNIIAVQQMNMHGQPMSFGEWMWLALPIAVTGTVLVWCLIIILLRPDDVEKIPKILSKPTSPVGDGVSLFVCCLR
mmetsp:Transcript_17890/g.35863  ORF Transcript_17890/g.35863 Transcript_17890/m.35863 type:complete len:314 (+) Transcript_17890:1-942(+)